MSRQIHHRRATVRHPQKIYENDIDEYTKVLSHFDESATKDTCGNIWILTGNPSIDTTNAKFEKALQLNGNYISLNSGITLGGKDFTIDFFVAWTNLSDWRTPLCISNMNGTYRYISLRSGGPNIVSNPGGAYGATFLLETSISLNRIYHIVYVYNHGKCFVDGQLKSTKTMTYEVSQPNIVIGSGFGYPFYGAIDEFNQVRNMANKITGMNN